MQSPVAVAALLRMATDKFPTSEEGQDLLEYGLLAALIAVVAIGAVTTVGQTIYTVFWQVIQGAFGAISIVMAPQLVLILGLAAAVVTDVRTRRIPNWLTGAIGGAGFGIAFGGGVVTPAQAALGMLVGLLLMMPGHLIGATGAGDVKLMAAIGIVSGPASSSARFSIPPSRAASSRSPSPRAADCWPTRSTARSAS